MKILFLLICLLFPAHTLFAGPPDEALSRISAAIDSGDTAAFEELVDIDAILSQAMDSFILEMKSAQNKGQLAPMLALLLSQQADQEDSAIRKLLKQETKAFVLNGISSGAFAGKKLQSSQNSGLLAPLFANASTGRKEIRGIGDSVPADTGWLLPFSVHDYGNDNDYVIIGKFEPNGNSARLTSIENLDQIFEQIKKEAAADW